MSMQFLQSIDMHGNQILNLVIQELASDPGSPATGQIWFNTTNGVLKMYDGTGVRTLAGLQNKVTDFTAPTVSFSLNSQTITNLGTPVNSTDAATKGYVDSVALGLDVKASVIAATTVAGTLASSFANGSVIDGVTLATGNRILIKNQASASDNGIYIVNASGAPTRSTDCNSSTTYVTGAFVFVEEGSINQGAAFVVNTQGTITPGTTAVTWVQFSGSSSTASNLSGGSTGSIPYQSAPSTTAYVSPNTAATDQVLVSHGTGSAGQAPTLTNAPALSAANMTSFPTLNQNTTGSAASLSAILPISEGGTNANTAAGAKTNLGFTTKYAATIGNGSSTSIVVNHNLGTSDVVVFAYYVATPFQQIQTEVQITDTNDVTLLFATAPAANSIRVVVIG